MSRNVFLDCGTNLCQGLNEIIQKHKMDNSWLIYSFEVNPYTFNQINKEKFTNVIFINKGLWTENCYRELTIEIWPGQIKDYHAKFLNDSSIQNAPVGGASHILQDNWIKPNYISDEYIEKTTISVECIDLSEFIKQNFSKDDSIIMKIDIEGAEYPILQKMIKDSTIDLINEIYIEWHPQISKIKYNQNEIISILKSKNIKINDWQ